jgi:hypothetical protein
MLYFLVIADAMLMEGEGDENGQCDQKRET